jgi:N-acetylglucosaminyldiphosphoundecaprenol N-acetyl-beta-D-mannosaminyltransferase
MALLEYAERAGQPVGFYGGEPETLELLSARLKDTYPELRVVYMHSPPFRPLREEETQADLASIRESGARLLFVGLGGPKQELWMSKHSSQLPCVLLGVGAALKILAGEIQLPPKWIQRLGLTWVVRFAQEPRNVFKRIVFYLPRFTILALLDLVGLTRRRGSEAICEKRV